jgi:hypothetical protein
MVEKSEIPENCMKMMFFASSFLITHFFSFLKFITHKFGLIYIYYFLIHVKLVLIISYSLPLTILLITVEGHGKVANYLIEMSNLIFPLYYFFFKEKIITISLKNDHILTLQNKNL